jgi:hypothetical protein
MDKPELILDMSNAEPTTTKQQEDQAMKIRHKDAWDHAMGSQSRRVRHNKTSVLMLSWDKNSGDLDVADELRRLRLTFEQTYGFKVYEKQIKDAGSDGRKKPRTQVARHLSEFVDEEDFERGLLIIYYAGHGLAGRALAAPQSGLVLLPKSGAPPISKEERELREKLIKKNGIVWDKVENAISDTEADVLLIFDCCAAGSLCTPRRSARGSYFEFLGACAQNETTRGPGEYSFTAALITVLEKLALEEKTFSTLELKTEIIKHEKFPHKKQNPVLEHRRKGGEHIVISRKGLKPTQTPLAKSQQQRHEEMLKHEFLDLRFEFPHAIEQEHVEAAASWLKDWTEKEETDWCRVHYLNTYHYAKVYAWKWMDLTSTHRKSVTSAEQRTTSSSPLNNLTVDGPSPSRYPATPFTPAGSNSRSGTSSIRSTDEHSPLRRPRARGKRKRDDDQDLGSKATTGSRGRKARLRSA